MDNELTIFQRKKSLFKKVPNIILVPVNRSDTESIQFQTMTLVQHELKPNHYQIAENCTLNSVAMRKNESLYL